MLREAACLKKTDTRVWIALGAALLVVFSVGFYFGRRSIPYEISAQTARAAEPVPAAAASSGAEASAAASTAEKESQASAGKQAPSEKVNINTADAETLQTLPGIGEVLAGRILEYRKRLRKIFGGGAADGRRGNRRGEVRRDQRSGSQWRIQNMKILVVDDEDLLVKGIRFNLENEGYTVLTGSDGVQAVDIAANQHVDLIVLDLMMPKLDGLGACRKIREFSDVPIIMLTAKADDMDKLMGFEHGADDYITKPFNILELKARIRALLRRSASGPQARAGEPPRVRAHRARPGRAGTPTTAARSSISRRRSSTSSSF
jgi:CheY-like chemotaxis protein